VVQVPIVIATAALCTVRYAAMLSCAHVDMQPASAGDASAVSFLKLIRGLERATVQEMETAGRLKGTEPSSISHMLALYSS
jgi:hypothetical protein